MQRYIVKFVEVRHYEMTVYNRRKAAIRHSANGPDNPLWMKVELERFEAKEIAAKARDRGPALATAGPGPSFEVPAIR